MKVDKLADLPKPKDYINIDVTHNKDHTSMCVTVSTNPWCPKMVFNCTQTVMRGKRQRKKLLAVESMWRTIGSGGGCMKGAEHVKAKGLSGRHVSVFLLMML